MPKISAVMSVLNEENLLPALLENINPHVDEIVIVDGGPDGPSTDRTKEIAKSCDKVLYQSGKFATLDGAWDMATQRNTAITHATGEMLLFVSADMFFSGLEILREVANAGKYKIVFCTTLEFWSDINHLRLYTADGDVLTMPSSILEPIAIDRLYNPYAEEDGRFNLDGAVIGDRIQLPQINKFHLGWIRPFKQQVAKHIRHVKQHRWGEHGEKLLRGGERGLEQWAMLHVLSYSNIPSIACSCVLPPELEEFIDMKFDDGAKESVEDFERRFGISPFKMQGTET
jgi:glycosyltransferase involved in cell wall biosynthesis